MFVEVIEITAFEVFDPDNPFCCLPEDDGNVCTDDVCDFGTPTNIPVFGGQCVLPDTTGGICNFSGECCIFDSDCAMQ